MLGFLPGLQRECYLGCVVCERARWSLPRQARLSAESIGSSTCSAGGALADVELLLDKQLLHSSSPAGFQRRRAKFGTTALAGLLVACVWLIGINLLQQPSRLLCSAERLRRSRRGTRPDRQHGTAGLRRHTLRRLLRLRSVRAAQQQQHRNTTPRLGARRRLAWPY